MRKRHIILLVFFSFIYFLGQAQNLKAIKNTGNTFFENEKYEEARNYFSMYYKQEKNDLDAILKLGICSFETNRLAEAKEFLNFYTSNQKNPSARSYLYLAKALHANNDFRAAAREYKKFIREAKETNLDRNWAKEAVRRCGAGVKIEAIDRIAFVENLGEKVNSTANDFRPVLSPNYDDKLYFSSNRRGSVGGKRDEDGMRDDEYGSYKSDMYSSRVINGEWTATSPFNSLLNTARNEMVLDFNGDGQVMYYFKGGNLNSGDILVDTFRSDESQRSLFSPRFRGPMDGQYGDGYPHFYNDTVLVFSSRRAGGFGGSDLYYSIFSEGKWTQPKNLGANINTPFDETSPYLSLNGRTLYFSSNNRRSIGGFDIFKSQFDENRAEWMASTNLGLPINSSEDDMGFRMSKDGLKGYFSSKRKEGAGGEDLYVSYFKKVQVEQEINSRLLTFHDVILDNRKNMIAGAGEGGNNGSSYAGYNISEIENYEMEALYYESDDQVMTPANIKKLNQIAGILKKWPDIKVELTSNSDERGPSQFDLYFSIKRVEELGNYLKRQGARSHQIIMKGTGSQYGVALNYLNGQASLIGQRMNRRIDIKFHNTEEFPVRVSIKKPKVSELLASDDWGYYQKMKGGLSYKVQIAATKQMYNNDAVLSRFSDITIETTQDTGLYKYAVGLYKTFASASELKKELERAGVIGAFVVPYINGVRTTDDDTKILAASYPDLLNFIASKSVD